MCSGTRLCSSSGAMVCMDMPSSLRSRIMPPVTPSKLANAGVLTLWRSEWRLSIARLWFTAGLYFLRAEFVGGWPIAVMSIMMRVTHTNEKYTPGYIALGHQRTFDCRSRTKLCDKCRMALFDACYGQGAFPYSEKSYRQA